MRDGTPPAAPGPFGRALADLRARLEPRTTDDWRQRFADSMARYFDGCLLELPYRRARRLRRRARGAFDAAAAVYNADLEAFAALLDRFVARATTADERAYARALAAWVHGNHAWTQTSQRNAEMNRILGDESLSGRGRAASRARGARRRRRGRARGSPGAARSTR